jgi:mannonate dehydratase
MDSFTATTQNQCQHSDELNGGVFEKIVTFGENFVPKPMEKTWRWFGPKDPITLPMLRQIGVEGIVTSLHDVPAGTVWTTEKVEELSNYIKSHGLHWSVVESLPVSEAIKYRGPEADRLIEDYITSLESLGKAGVKTVCYNFMPVIDWIRTDLRHPWADGSTSLYFDRTRFAYFDLKILARQGAEADYTPHELAAVEALDKTITPAEKDELIDSIIVKTQGFVHGNIKEGDKDPVSIFRRLLALYDGIDRDTLRENMRLFLAAIMPVCQKYGIGMCVHPDDPPWAVLGLPRIVTSAEDIEWILKAVDNPCNGLTFCAGSLSAGAHNDVVDMARRFAPRTHFVHLRSTEILPGGNFIETSHLGGRGNLIELTRIFERQKPSLPMRIDHGRAMLDDSQKPYNAGYPLIGRMFALAQIDGVMATVRNEIANNYEKHV